jgi:hypothetical protein
MKRKSPARGRAGSGEKMGHILFIALLYLFAMSPAAVYGWLTVWPAWKQLREARRELKILDAELKELISRRN